MHSVNLIWSLLPEFEPFYIKSPPHRCSPFKSLSLQFLLLEVIVSFTLCAYISGSLWNLKPSDSPLILFPTMWKGNFWKRSDFQDTEEMKENVAFEFLVGISLFFWASSLDSQLYQGTNQWSQIRLYMILLLTQELTENIGINVHKW